MSNNESTVTPENVVQAFYDVLNNAGPAQAAEYLSQDFTYESSDMGTLTTEQWIGAQAGYLIPFPDLTISFELLCVEDNVISGIVQASGTHTGDFDLSQMGLGIIAPTGKSINAAVWASLVVEKGKITSITEKTIANLGFAGTLAQLGIEIPQTA